jgi:tRNA-splicing ligase RtcB (3'-phosphate/5'-hydroxy nucleic acid ligase)
MGDFAVFGEHDQVVVDQLARCLAGEEGARGALCADGHLGYSAPIGGVMAYREHVSPSGVGYDIGCGNKAVLTDLLADDVRPVISELMDRVFAEVSFGMGRRNPEPIDHPVLDAIREAPFAPQRALLDLAAKQLGTVGAGNHYVDLFSDDAGRVWVGVHFGSRGFGHKTASGFLSLAAGGRFEERGSEGEMEAPPTLLATTTELGQAYVEAMTLAGAYAYAGRDVVVGKVLGILGASALEEVHNHHNYAWHEEHDGEQWWVVRKGATPARPGQLGFVGATMGEDSVILEGVESERSAQALYSTVHGAGRAMSRTAAAGKSRRRWTCLNRECDWAQGAGQHKPGRCPKCGHDQLGKRLVRLTEGAIDWDAARADLVARGIELRGAAADEAPGAYKRLDEVLAHHAGTVRVLHTLTPLGVAMAGPDTFDPFKD